MLLLIAGILVALWLLGFVAHIAGVFIHLLLIIALVIFVGYFLRGRKAV